MEPNKSNSSSNGMNLLQVRIRKLWFGFICVQVLSLLILLIAIEFSAYRNKVNLAHSVSTSLSNDLVIKNYRHVAEVLSLSIRSDFVRIELRDLANNKVIEVANQFQPVFSKKIIIPIFFDLSEKVKMGELTFFYKPLSSLAEFLIAWLTLFMVSAVLLLKFRRELIKEYDNELRLATALQMTELAKKVAHDIRSPLSALNILTQKNIDLNLIENKSIIHAVSDRINGIAEELLAKSKGSPDLSIKTFATIRENISSIKAGVLDLLLEKKLEYSKNSKIQFHFRDSLKSQTAIISLPLLDLKTILSNLLNNSVEAVVEDGNIFVEISDNENFLIMSIIDFGKGIPEEILAKLTHEAISHGKNDLESSGSGIGIYTASNTIRTAGGKISVESRLNIGTKVSIYIPKVMGLL